MVAESSSAIALKDGTPVVIRPIRPDDVEALVESFRHLSPQTIYQRFFTNLHELPLEMARSIASPDHVGRLALIAESGNEVIGVGRYERTDVPGLAELGLVILDDWQNRGLGRILLRETLRAAERNGIRQFRAEVLAENRRMLHLLATEGDITGRKTEAGVTTLFFTTRSSSLQ